MLSKNLENSPSYDILYIFWKKARAYYTLSISRGGAGLRDPPGMPGFATDLCEYMYKVSRSQHVVDLLVNDLDFDLVFKFRELTCSYLVS